MLISMRSVHNTNDQYTLISCVELTILNFWHQKPLLIRLDVCRARLKCDATGAEIIFRLSAKRTSPFKPAGTSVHSTTGSRGVRISGSMLDTPCSEVVWRVLATHSIRQFPLHFPCRASPCAITFQLESTRQWRLRMLWSRHSVCAQVTVLRCCTVLVSEQFCALLKDRCALFWVKHTKPIFY